MWTQHPASYGRGLGSAITRVLGKTLDQATIAGYRRERNPIWV